MTILVTALVTLTVTVLAGVVLDYIRHGRPKITYSVKDAIPIDLDGKCVGAYLVSLSNPSKRVVKDVSCHIQASPAKLRNAGITASQGLQYCIADKEKGIQLLIPFLKEGDELQMTVIAEGLTNVPSRPDVAIRSPMEINVEEIRQGMRARVFPLPFLIPAIIAGIVAGAAVEFGPGTGVIRDPRDVLTFAASVAGLPRLAELYATSANDLAYYDQGDLAYAGAAASSDPSEIDKYRRFLHVTLEIDSGRMWSASRANLYYSLGKIDLLMGDNNGALRDFREAIAQHKSLVGMKTNVDSKVSEFLIANGIH